MNGIPKLAFSPCEWTATKIIVMLSGWMGESEKDGDNTFRLRHVAIGGIVSSFVVHFSECVRSSLFCFHCRL